MTSPHISAAQDLTIGTELDGVLVGAQPATSSVLLLRQLLTQDGLIQLPFTGIGDFLTNVLLLRKGYKKADDGQMTAAGSWGDQTGRVGANLLTFALALERMPQVQFERQEFIEEGDTVRLRNGTVEGELANVGIRGQSIKEFLSAASALIATVSGGSRSSYALPLSSILRVADKTPIGAIFTGQFLNYATLCNVTSKEDAEALLDDPRAASDPIRLISRSLVPLRLLLGWATWTGAVTEAAPVSLPAAAGPADRNKKAADLAKGLGMVLGMISKAPELSEAGFWAAFLDSPVVQRALQPFPHAMDEVLEVLMAFEAVEFFDTLHTRVATREWWSEKQVSTYGLNITESPVPLPLYCAIRRLAFARTSTFPWGLGERGDITAVDGDAFTSPYGQLVLPKESRGDGGSWMHMVRRFVLETVVPRMRFIMEGLSGSAGNAAIAKALTSPLDVADSSGHGILTSVVREMKKLPSPFRPQGSVTDVADTIPIIVGNGRSSDPGVKDIGTLVNIPVVPSGVGQVRPHQYMVMRKFLTWGLQDRMNDIVIQAAGISGVEKDRAFETHPNVPIGFIEAAAFYGQWPQPLGIDFLSGLHPQAILSGAQVTGRRKLSPELLDELLPPGRKGESVIDAWSAFRAVCRDAVRPGNRALLRSLAAHLSQLGILVKMRKAKDKLTPKDVAAIAGMGTSPKGAAKIEDYETVRPSGLTSHQRYGYAFPMDAKGQMEPALRDLYFGGRDMQTILETQVSELAPGLWFVPFQYVPVPPQIDEFLGDWQPLAGAAGMDVYEPDLSKDASDHETLPDVCPSVAQFVGDIRKIRVQGVTAVPEITSLRHIPVSTPLATRASVALAIGLRSKTTGQYTASEIAMALSVQALHQSEGLAPIELSDHRFVAPFGVENIPVRDSANGRAALAVTGQTSVII
jgi:hypothetical protein